MLNEKKHRKIMFEILRDIYQSELGFYLGFKGGTMLYFFYNLDRFSVDLDFDLLLPEDSKLGEDEVLQKIGKILSRYGKVDDLFNKNYTLFGLLNYAEGERNLKIEISKRISFKNKYEFKNLYGINVRCMVIEDAFAHKLLAATGRRVPVNRDFYDLHFFWKNGYSFNEKIVEKISGKSMKEYLKYLKKYVEKNLNSQNVLQGVGELLTESKKDWAKDNLKKELLQYIEMELDK